MIRLRHPIRFAVKVLLTLGLCALQFFVHSPFWHAALGLVVLLLWSPELMRLLDRVMGRWRWLFLLLPLGVVTTMGFMLPRRAFDANHRINMLVLQNGQLSEPSWSSYFQQCLVPEGELLGRHATVDSINGVFRPAMSGLVSQHFAGERPVYIITPEHMLPDMKYHVVAVTGDNKETGIDYQRLFARLSNNIVVTLAPRGTNGSFTPADLSLLTRSVIPGLKQLGLKTDSCMMTLVDTSPNGVLAQEAARTPGRQWRNIVWVGAKVDSTLEVAAHARLVLTGNRPSYRDVYQHWRDLGLDTDWLQAATLTQALPLIANVVDGIAPVATSRLERAHAMAIAREFNEQYVMFVDYSIPSGKYRFFIYDYNNHRYIVQSKCGHGCGPGNTDEQPVFSNDFGSCCASLGDFAVLDVRAMFKNGRIAIDLEGLDPTNNNARDRGLMIHGGMKREGEIYPEYLHIGILSEGCVALSDIPFAYTATLREYSDKHILLQAYY